jgi:hypothetical protein
MEKNTQTKKSNILKRVVHAKKNDIIKRDAETKNLTL